MEQVLEFISKHPLLSGGFVAVLGLLIWTEIHRKLQGLQELSPAQVVAWMNDSDTVLVDVSAAADFNKGHILNARNMALSRIQSPDAEVQKMLKSKLVVVCKTGQTSVQAAAALKKQGANDVAILKGGMARWLGDQYPVTRK
ncbi:MAG: rhodanese-like domain-containing protein [Xanthomonadales bacterium]|nr:rhodanese-like domain-containing protein [Xanthomonadales bacterium]